MNEWLSLGLAGGTGLAGAAVGYGLTLGRLRSVERDVERIDREKASKEAHDGTQSALRDLRGDIDRRFDRIERLLIARGGTDPG